MASRTSELTLHLVDDISKPARDVATALAQAEARVKEIAGAMADGTAPTDRLVSALSKIGASKVDIDQVAAAWADYTRTSLLAAESSDWTKEQASAVRSWESQTISSVRAVVAERRAETTAMRNAAIEQNNILRKQGDEQATLIREQATAQREAATKRRELARGVASGLGGGLLGALAGGATLEALKESMGLGATVDTRVAQLRSMGVTDKQIEDSRAQFRDYSKAHPGMLEADWLKARGEAATIAPGDESEMTVLAARYRAAARASGTPIGENDFLSTMRTMDEMGLRTPEQREKFLNQMLKVQQKFQGTVTPETYLSAVQNLRSSKFALGEDFMTNYFPTLLQATGEQGGTEIMTAFNNLVGGHMTHSELKKLADAGFVDNKDLDYTKTGEIKGTKPGAKMFEESLFEKNPFQWSNDFHDAFMKRQGSTEESFDKLVMSMPRNAGALIEEFVHNRQRYERDAANNKQQGLDADKNLANNPAAAASALKDSLEQLATSIAAPGVQALAPALAASATQVQKWAADIGGLNQNMVALSGGILAAGLSVAGFKAAFGLGGSLFGGGAALKGSALALDASAEQLTAAAIALRGGSAADLLGHGGHGPGRSPTGMGWRAGSAALGAAGLSAGAPSDDASIEKIINDPSQSAAAQNVAAAVDAVRRLAADAESVFKGGGEIIRRPSRDVHSPSSGPLSYVPAVDTSGLDAAKGKIDSVSDAAAHGAQMRVDVDTGAIDAALQKVIQLRAAVDGVNAAALSKAASIPTHIPPSLNSTMNGNFSFSGVHGE
jgi:hypothetical protein